MPTPEKIMEMLQVKLLMNIVQQLHEQSEKAIADNDQDLAFNKSTAASEILDYIKNNFSSLVL